MTDKGRAVKSRRWLRVAFLVSCGINLAVAGTFVGVLSQGKEPREGRRYRAPEASMLIGSAVFRELDRPERDALRKLAKGDHPDILERRKAETEELLDLIRGPQPDVQALRETIAAQHKRLNAIRAVMQDAWIEKVVSMSQEERNRLADRVQTHLMRPPRH